MPRPAAAPATTGAPRGSPATRAADQNSDSAACTAVPAISSRGVRSSAASSILPAPFVAASASRPPSSACTVDGTPPRVPAISAARTVTRVDRVTRSPWHGAEPRDVASGPGRLDRASITPRRGRQRRTADSAPVELQTPFDGVAVVLQGALDVVAGAFGG